MRRVGWLLAGILACALGGCDDGGAEAEGPRVDRGVVERTCEARAAELRAACPPGSDPLVSATATAECRGAARELADPDGTIRGICEASDGCLVVCNFQDPCTCGIDRITAEGVFCAECSAACGNQICEGGESPQSCPEDCGSICTAGEERCAGDDREICEVDGDWGRAECRRDQACALANGGVTVCQTRISPAGGSFVAPGGAAAEIEGAPLEIRFQEGAVCANCEPLRFVEGGARVLALEGAALWLVDPASGASEATPFTIRGAFAVTEHHVATSAREPIVVDRARNTTFTAEAFVHDAAPLEVGAVALTPDGSGLAVAMRLSDAPFVALWSTDRGEARHLVRLVDPGVVSNAEANALAFSANGALLVEARADALVVWNVAEGRYVHLIATDAGSVTDLHFSPTGAPQVLVAGTRAIELWDIEIPARIWRVEADSQGVAISPDGSTIASREDGVVLRHFEDGRLERRLDGRGRVHFSPDGRRLLVGRVIYRDSF